MTNTNTQKCFICLDQGSSSSRALAVSLDGKVLLSASRKLLPVVISDNMCEYDADALLKSQTEALDEVLSKLPPGYKPLCIGIASQRSTIVFWDKNTGRPICPVLSWLDGRGIKEIAANTLSQEEVHQITGLYKTPYYSAPKIRWCLDNYTQAAAALKEGSLLVAPVASFIIWHLTQGKVFASDATLAQRTMLFNINTLDWDEQMLKSFNLPAAILPKIQRSVDDYGSYKGIPISVCVGDQQAAAAYGVESGGDININYGTGAFVLANAGPQPKNVAGILTSLSWDGAGKKADYLLEAPLNVAGSLLNWLNGIGLDFKTEDLDDICARSKNPVWFLPALGGLSAPYWDFSVTPVITGLTPKTNKEDIINGAVRGLAFLLADIAFYIKTKGGVEISGIKASGGFADSKALLQFQSDIMGLKIQRNLNPETTALGVAYLCALANNHKALHWEAFNIYNLIEPKLEKPKAQAIYKRWQAFFNWAVKQKDFN